jgi:Holliday junction resolvase
MKEADLSRKIVKALRERGAWAEKIHGSAYQTVGLPDIVGCHCGCFFGFEVKLPGRERNLTPIQAVTLAAIEKAGGVGVMITSVKQALEFLDHIEEELDPE